jgi:hypothetical protein
MKENAPDVSHALASVRVRLSVWPKKRPKLTLMSVWIAASVSMSVPSKPSAWNKLKVQSSKYEKGTNVQNSKNQTKMFVKALFERLDFKFV